MNALQVEFAIEASEDSMAVIAQAYHPAWQATIDGKATRVIRANGVFQAVTIPAGQHHVVLRYLDRRFRIGLAKTLTTLAGLIVFLWRDSS